MSKSQESGCLSYIFGYACFITIPALIIGLLGLNESYIFAYVICLIISFFLSFPLFVDLLSKIKNDNFTNVLHAALVMLLTILMLVVYTVVFDVDVYKETKNTSTSSVATSTRRVTSVATTTPSRNDKSISLYYQRNYPATWGYIKKYSDDPETYIEVYDLIWGDLQEYHGDGIVFDTLTKHEQSLVNYPRVGSAIYLAQGGITYHSTPDCYTLLRSKIIARGYSYVHMYTPCSKCVMD